MAELSKNKKYLTLENVRISHKKSDDSIHLVSGDDEFPQGFHLSLQKGTFVEEQVRELLKEYGLISEDHVPLPSLPKTALWHNHYCLAKEISPGFFPLGVAETGGVETTSPYTGEKVHLIGVDFWGKQNSLSQVSGKPVDPMVTLTPHCLIGGSTGSGKSIAIRTIIGSALLRSDWEVVAIDFKKIELEAFSEHAKAFAYNLSDAARVLSEVTALLAARYQELERRNFNNFLDLQSGEKSILVVFDEIGPLAPASDDKPEDAALKREIKDHVATIARLGRAAGIHLVVSAQRFDATILPSRVIENFGARINCGRTSPSQSSFLLGSEEGTKVRPHPRGRFYMKAYGEGKMGQLLFWPLEELKKTLLWEAKKLAKD